MIVEWYRNNHENRNDMLRFGLMRLDRQGVVTFRQFPLARCVEAVSPHPLHGMSIGTPVFFRSAMAVELIALL